VASARYRRRPNIIIVLADDQGWRDTGYQGSPEIKTPNLDDSAAKGVRFDYFYAAQNVCSSGRFAIMTGRTPFRGGLYFLDYCGKISPKEIMLAKALKTAVYQTGHFGKWHLGEPDSETYPTRMGFDTSYYSYNYFDISGKLTINDTKETVAVKGDSSVFTANLAIDWITQAAGKKEPFFAYVCFGSPNNPQVGVDEFKALNKNPRGNVDFLAEVSGVDAAVGNLRSALKKLGLSDNTLLWFTSDNGGATADSLEPNKRKKGQIGIRTVSCLEWTGRIKQPIRTSVSCVHMEMYPTVLEACGVSLPPNQPVLDGISLLPLLEGKIMRRDKPIGFMLLPQKLRPAYRELSQLDFVRQTEAIWIDGSEKLVVPLPENEKKEGMRLFDIHADPAEKTNLADKRPERVAAMQTASGSGSPIGDAVGSGCTHADRPHQSPHALRGCPSAQTVVSTGERSPGRCSALDTRLALSCRHRPLARCESYLPSYTACLSFWVLSLGSRLTPQVAPSNEVTSNGVHHDKSRTADYKNVTDVYREHLRYTERMTDGRGLWISYYPWPSGTWSATIAIGDKVGVHRKAISWSRRDKTASSVPVEFPNSCWKTNDPSR